MKKLISFICLSWVSALSICCATNIDNTDARNEAHQNTILSDTVSTVYKLFPTENMWIFIKLNTRNGQMWLIQYSTDSKNRGEYYFSLPVISPGEETNGRFTLFPTQNMYNFILLDQISGKTWQAQWSIDIDNRLVIPIDSEI